MADAPDSGSGALRGVRVQLPPSAPTSFFFYKCTPALFLIFEHLDFPTLHTRILLLASIWSYSFNCLLNIYRVEANWDKGRNSKKEVTSTSTNLDKAKILSNRLALRRIFILPQFSYYFLRRHKTFLPDVPAPHTTSVENIAYFLLENRGLSVINQ